MSRRRQKGDPIQTKMVGIDQKAPQRIFSIFKTILNILILAPHNEKILKKNPDDQVPQNDQEITEISMLGRLGVARNHGFMRKAYTRCQGYLRAYLKGKTTSLITRELCLSLEVKYSASEQFIENRTHSEPRGVSKLFRTGLRISLSSTTSS